jgi:predicted ATPase
VLTRLEVAGFKNLRDLSVEFGPFTCVAGENAAGKSNLFDAVEFLALLADRPLMEAAQQVRASLEHRAGDPRDLFWGRNPEGASIDLAAEMIVPSDVDDDFGQPARAAITLLRYEVRIAYEPPVGARKLGRLVLLSEALRHIKLGDAPRHLRFPNSAKRWRRRWSAVVGAAPTSSRLRATAMSVTAPATCSRPFAAPPTAPSRQVGQGPPGRR